MKLRQRDQQKEIGPQFHFKPKSYFEKFTHKLQMKNPSNSIMFGEMFSNRLITKRGEIRRNIVTQLLRSENVKTKEFIEDEEEEDVNNNTGKWERNAHKSS